MGLDDRCAGGGNVAAHALAGEEQLFAVHIGLFSGPCKDILCIGVQAVKAHILELAVALAVAVEIEPGAADALRCQSAGHMGVHGLVAAAAAGKAVQMAEATATPAPAVTEAPAEETASAETADGALRVAGLKGPTTMVLLL